MQPHEEEALRARIHKLSDQVQAHEVRMGEHGILLTVLNNHYEALRGSTATKDGLESAIASTKLHIDTSVSSVVKDVKGVEEKLVPIQRGIYWSVALIIAAVLTALLSLVVHGVR